MSVSRPNLLVPPVDNSSTGITADVVNLVDFCEAFYDGIKIPTTVPPSKMWNLLCEFSTQLTKNLNIETPSVFKRAAALTVAFIVSSPLDRNFNGGTIGKELTAIKNHQNAIIGFEYCRYALTGAVIMPKKRAPFTLGKPIAVSQHFYRDLIHAFSHIENHSFCFHSTAMIYESLCYKSNVEASDPEIA